MENLDLSKIVQYSLAVNKQMLKEKLDANMEKYINSWCLVHNKDPIKLVKEDRKWIINKVMEYYEDARNKASNSSHEDLLVEYYQSVLGV